jgi:hypothetical protein
VTINWSVLSCSDSSTMRSVTPLLRLSMSPARHS